MYIYRHSLLGEVVSSHLSDYIQLTVRVGCKLLLGDLDYIVVVSSCHTFIGGDHKIATFSVLFLDVLSAVEIQMLHLRNMSEHSGKSNLKCIEVRLRVLKICPRLFQLGR